MQERRDQTRQEAVTGGRWEEARTRRMTQDVSPSSLWEVSFAEEQRGSSAEGIKELPQPAYTKSVIVGAVFHQRQWVEVESWSLGKIAAGCFRLSLPVSVLLSASHLPR